ncbi:MAG: Fur family transcriptional regulator [Campylobacterota bacterium]|nr:Fur family transcriptional regulator [Campylobacterota bacterium]
MNEYAGVLKASGLKTTLQRIGILEVIDRAGHISIDAIYSEIRETNPILSLATVYKNILMMVDKDVLVEVPLSGAKSKYELKKHEHIHLICEKCGSVEDEILDNMPEEALSALAAKDSFLLSRSQINLYGICQNCQ